MKVTGTVRMVRHSEVIKSCAHRGHFPATFVAPLILFLFLTCGEFAGAQPDSDAPIDTKGNTESSASKVASLRTDIELAMSDGKLAEQIDGFIARVQPLITELEDTNNRLSAIKLAGRLCWDGPPEKTNKLRGLAFAELVRLSPTSPRARVMLVDQFLPPLHQLRAEERAAMLARWDDFVGGIASRCDDAATKCDLRYMQCMARIEAARAWNCAWLDAAERARVDGWLAELGASEIEAPAGGLYRDIASALRNELRGAAMGTNIADSEAPNLDGEVTRLAAFRGKVVILSFWSSWCVPCLELIREESALVERLGDKAVLVGVNADATTAQARRTVAAHKMTWPQVWSPPDTESSLVSRLFIRQWPSVIILDRSGKIQAKFVGSAYQGRLTMAEVEKAAWEILARE